MVFPKIITISGVDGTGKTTISDSIKKYFENKGHKVHIYHSGVDLKTSSDPKQKMSSYVGFIVFIKDCLKIIFQYISSLGQYNYIIFDRFLYDSIIKISYKQKLTYIPSPYVFLAKVLFPIHHNSFLLIAPPFASVKRDNEHQKDYHIRKFLLYKTLPKLFHLKIINAEKSVPTVIGQIKKHL